MKIDMFIGVDAGASGGIVSWDELHRAKAYHMPKDVQGMLKLFNLLKSLSENPLAFIEKIQIRPDDVGGKQYRIAKMLANFEQLKTCMTAAGIAYVMVHPMTWQNYLHLRVQAEEKADRKNRYKRAAGRYYPEIKATLWNADASLLVEFGRRKNQYDENWIIEQLPKQLTTKLI